MIVCTRTLRLIRGLIGSGVQICSTVQLHWSIGIGNCADRIPSSFEDWVMAQGGADQDGFFVVDVSPSTGKNSGAKQSFNSLSAPAAKEDVSMDAPSAGGLLTSIGRSGIQPISHHCSVKWRKGMELPHGVYRAQMLQLAGKIYLGGGDAPDKYNVIQEYNPAACVWSELTKSPVERAALAELGGKLLLAGNHVEGQAIGGRYSQVESNTRLTVWEAECSDWIHPYPHMENGRSYAAAVGYQNKLAVACGLAGLEEIGTVEVLDCAARTWHSADSVPLQGHHMSSAVIEDHWYISAHYWRDNKPHVFCTRLPSLASNASNVWCELGAPPVRSSTLLAYNSHLLLLGGLKQSSILQKDTFQDDIYCYEPSANTWRKCGKLPSKMSGCSCAVLPSGELLVVGGYNVKGKYSYSTQTWIGRLT